jgi:hypothetical protein
MSINRWIGQAVATQDIKYYIPTNVGAGDRFQFSDGVIRNGFTYPVIPPEHDLTASDRARRVVEALVSGATVNADLGGGTTTGLSYSSANYGGQPAVRVAGLTDGQPIGIVATAVSSVGNAVEVTQVQEGSSGRDFQFKLTWPVTPSAGSWAIAANGKNPVILPYNATTTEVHDALDTFGFPCGSITVTGSYSSGYVVTLVAPTAAIPNPPVLFPIVPVAGANGVIDMTFLEEHSYRFGSESGYVGGTVFEASITSGEMETYLSDTVRLGTLAADVTCVSTRLTPSSGYSAGVTMRFTFTTKAAYDAFVAMTKVQLNYTWTASSAGVPSSPNIAYQMSHVLGDTTSWKKVRQYPKLKVGVSGTLNPFDRKFHTVAYQSSPIATFVINDALGGYDATLVQARPHTVANSGSGGGFQFVTATAQGTWTSGTAENWVLVNTDIEYHFGVSSSTSDITFTVINDGLGAELGVNNNAGWTVETVGTPGIINQEILLPALDGDFKSLYQLDWDGKRSYKFTGASTIQLVKDAAESLFGVGNVAVGAESGSPYFCRIQFLGALSERVVNAALYKVGNTTAASDVSIDVEASTPMQAWVLRYRFNGGVCSGKWHFVSESGTPQSTPYFEWLRDASMTEAEIVAAINSVSADYETVLTEDDITLTLEDVGRQKILREFTITWQAQPSAPFSGGVAIPFWMGLDVDSLLTAEPSYEVVSLGATAQPEIQVVAIENKPTSGTWKLDYNGTQTAAIAYNASAATVQSALSAISVNTTVIGGNGGAYRIKWTSNGSMFMLVGVNVDLVRSGTPSFTVVNAVVGTGPKHFDNPDNWSLARVPIDTDEIVYADGSVDCSYGLSCATLPKSVDIYRSYGGRIGLPEIRDDGSLETLPLWLTFNGTSSTALFVRMGLGDNGDGPSVVRVAVNNRPFDAMVLSTQTGLTQKVFGVKGVNAANKLVCIKGDVALGVRPEDSARVATLQITPSQAAGDEMQFLSSGGAIIDKLTMQGGTASLGKPPTNLVMIGGTATINGEGDCQLIDAVNANIRWLANGTLGKYGVASQVQFGAGFASSSTSPDKIRIVCVGHGLSSGQRVYMRAYSGVTGIDGKVFSVTVIDADTFDLLGSLGTGTLTNYAGLVMWGVERSIVIRAASTLDFDSDGRTRDVVAPIVIQSTGTVTDSKVTIPDLRLWTEQVDELAYLGQFIELRRTARV